VAVLMLSVRERALILVKFDGLVLCRAVKMLLLLLSFQFLTLSFPNE
jgi:hypothetical protein